MSIATVDILLYVEHARGGPFNNQVKHPRRLSREKADEGESGPTMRTALIIEDEPDIAAVIAETVRRVDIHPTVVLDGQEGLDLGSLGTFDLILVDLLLPSRNGFDICRTLRASGVSTPIICLSAKEGDFDEIEALEMGADDFLRKPFSVEVLAARIGALMRRPRSTADATMFAGIKYDASSREAQLDDEKRVHLTPREGQVLALLIKAGDRPLSKGELLSKVWGSDFAGNPNVVEVYIRSLRKKLGRERVDTIPRTGYRLHTEK